MAAAYSLIDADAHISEVADLWTSRVSSRQVDQVPRVEVRDGAEVWVLADTVIDSVGNKAPVDWPGWPETQPPGLADCHPASHSAVDRLKYLDSVGIWAQVLYPNVAGFGAQQFLAIRDDELKLDCVRAYNDYLSEWTSTDARRLLGVMSIPFWDVKAAVAEVERGAALGHRGILFTGEPQRFGMPLLGNAHWDPLWAAAQETGLPIHFHLGGGEDSGAAFGVASLEERWASYGPPAAGSWVTAHLLMKNATQVADIITCGVLPRFPDLKFVSVESGIGWLPFLLEAIDYHWLALASKGHARTAELLPSELFKRQVYCTFWFEEIALQRMERDLPIENLLFETDFPHVTCLYGDEIAAKVKSSLSGVSPEARQRLLWDNAADLYRIPPSDAP